MFGLSFEWDEAKNLANVAKHGVDFDEAIQVFADPGVVLAQDRDVDGEERWQAIGFAVNMVLLLVVHTTRDDDGEETIRIISARPAIRLERRRYEDEMVRYTLETLPPISDERLEEMKRLAARPDSEIDTTDIPVMSEEQWATAKRRYLYRPVKRQITARVDADVVEWLKAGGKGYQSRLNAILRREMLASLRRG